MYYIAGAQYFINNYITTKDCYYVKLHINWLLESLLILIGSSVK